MELDHALSLLGDFGTSQKRQYFLLCLPAILSGFNVISNVFVVASPPARCAVPYNVTSADIASNVTTWENGTYILGPLISDGKGCGWTGEPGSVATVGHENVTAANSSSGAFVQPSGMAACSKYAYDHSDIGSTVVSQWDLVCDKAVFATGSSTVYMAGIFAGALVFGLLADRFGRKKIFIISTMMEAICGIASGLAPEYYSFVTFRFIVAGAGVGKFSSAYILGMELIGPSRRLMASIVIFYFYALGVIVTPAIVYFMRDWRHLLIASSAPALLFISYHWFVYESVRWLHSRGRMEEAEGIIRAAAATNRVTLPAQWRLLSAGGSADSKGSPDAGASSTAAPAGDSLLTVLKSRRLLLQSLAVALNWLVGSMGYYGLTLNSGNLAGNIYLNTLISGLVEFPAYTVGFLCERLGRKVPYVASMLLAAASSVCIVILAFALGDGLHGWAFVTADMVGKLGISSAFALAFLWSAELFPTTLRSSLMGICSTVARIGAITAPLIADAGKQVQNRPLSLSLHSIVFGILMLAAGGAALALPETANKPLPQTVNETQSSVSNRVKCLSVAAAAYDVGKNEMVPLHPSNGEAVN